MRNVVLLALLVIYNDESYYTLPPYDTARRAGSYGHGGGPREAGWARGGGLATRLTDTLELSTCAPEKHANEDRGRAQLHKKIL